MRIKSYDDVRRLTAYLQTVADWRDGFQRRADAAQRTLETVGLDPEEHDELLAEGAALLHLMYRLLRSSERRAA
jgi:hypothetical protein